MSAKANNFKIGLFVIAALILLLLGILAFGARSYFETKLRYETVVLGDASGLSVGSSVLFHGVSIGQVTTIDFTWNLYPESKSRDIVIDFETASDLLPRDYNDNRKARLEAATKKGLRAMVKSQGITGVSTLSLDFVDPQLFPPPELDFTPRYDYIPSAPSQFTQILESLENSLRQIQKIDLAAMSQTVNTSLTTMGLLAERLNKIDLEKFASDSDATLLELKATAVALQDTIKGMDLPATSKNAGELMTGLRETNTKLQTVLDNVGAMPVQQTIGDIRQAVDNLNGVLLELKTYPAGFIFGEPPLPAKSVKPPNP